MISLTFKIIQECVTLCIMLVVSALVLTISIPTVFDVIIVMKHDITILLHLQKIMCKTIVFKWVGRSTNLWNFAKLSISPDHFHVTCIYAYAQMHICMSACAFG